MLRESADATHRYGLGYQSGSLRRSIELFRAFRVEQSDPDRFYGLLAADSVSELSRWRSLEGALLVDVGGGPGYFSDAFSSAGARYVGIEPDAGELTARGVGGRNNLRGSGTAIPLESSSVDIAFSSNVLEHVSSPEAMLDEMIRVTRESGLIYLSWTPWLSPWGGHETSPWHYLGGRSAADRYADRRGHRPKNDFGRTLFACSVSRMLRAVADRESAGMVRVVDVLPRYHPWWARWIMRVPGAREVLSWNAVIVLERE